MPERDFSLDEQTRFWQKNFCNGGVAQLGERLNGIQEAKSSILFISTRISRVYDASRKPFFLYMYASAGGSMNIVSITKLGDMHAYVPEYRLLFKRFYACPFFAVSAEARDMTVVIVE